MKTKEELIAAVNTMPVFEYREVALKVPALEDPAPEAQVDQDGAVPMIAPDQYEDVPACWTAITEIGSNNPICFASNRYKLMQFKECFDPLINAHEDVTGKIMVNRGFAVLDLFPIDLNMRVPCPPSADGSSNGAVYQIGTSVYNSVDRTSALVIRFSVTDGSRIIAFPKNVATFYQAHVGAAKQKTDNYLELMTKIKEFWPQVVGDMSSTEVTTDLFNTITKDFKTDPAIVKALKIEIDSGAKYSLWSIMMEIYDRMERKYSKSDVHLRKRQDEFIASVMDWTKMLAVFG